jgi:hypothetical protein
MTCFKIGEVFAITIDYRKYHIECFEGDWDDLEKNNFILKDDIDEREFCFCSSCKKQIFHNQ